MMNVNQPAMILEAKNNCLLIAIMQSFTEITLKTIFKKKWERKQRLFCTKKKKFQNCSHLSKGWKKLNNKKKLQFNSAKLLTESQ